MEMFNFLDFKNVVRNQRQSFVPLSHRDEFEEELMCTNYQMDFSFPKHTHTQFSLHFLSRTESVFSFIHYLTEKPICKLKKSTKIKCEKLHESQKQLFLIMTNFSDANLQGALNAEEVIHHR